MQGYRIELGEIEATLERHPNVKSAVVAAVGERAGPKHLVAYVVADAANDEDLAEYLRQKLPELHGAGGMAQAGRLAADRKRQGEPQGAACSQRTAAELHAQPADPQPMRSRAWPL